MRVTSSSPTKVISVTGLITEKHNQLIILTHLHKPQEANLPLSQHMSYFIFEIKIICIKSLDIRVYGISDY